MGLFTIAADGKSIACHTCGLTSHNLNDVAQRYCGCCHLFLDPQEPRTGPEHDIKPEGRAEAQA